MTTKGLNVNPFSTMFAKSGDYKINHPRLLLRPMPHKELKFVENIFPALSEKKEMF